MQTIKKSICVLIIFIFCAGVIYAGGQSDSGGWKPSKAIRIIVPAETGSPVDRITRMIAADLRTDLGARFNIVNTPGDSGATGTKAAMDAPKDGYTWAAGTTGDLATYKLFDMLDTSIADDWELFLSLGNTGLVGVSADSKYQTFDQLLDEFKVNPGQIRVASAGELSESYFNIEIIRRYTGINYRLSVYEDVNAALAAVISGGAAVIIQPASEQAELIRSKKIRPLAVLSESDINLEGYGAVPSIKKAITNFSFGLNYYGIFIPKNVPEEVITAVTGIWNSKIANNEELKKYASQQGVVLAPASGAEAQRKALNWYQPVVWMYFDAGKTGMSPNLVGIPRP